MSYIKNLSVAFTPADETAIMNGLDAALTALNAVKIVTLTPEQRREIPAVNAGRIPYVLKAVNVLGPAYPELVGKAVSTASAQQATNSWTFLKDVLMKVQEINDRARDLSQNLENTSYNYTTDMYYTAKRYVDDLPGADTVVAELSPLYEGQGDTINPTPNP
jgi:hypothetical protein